MPAGVRTPAWMQAAAALPECTDFPCLKRHPSIPTVPNLGPTKQPLRQFVLASGFGEWARVSLCKRSQI
ncbi:unnamed protein product [Ectocarpus sp. CCAP 1310/34]|nr:unnamed protein product [Ectocarpus sp. CCAP 1310/34]